jgi:uncharacterized membrane protein (DUF2068 family)
MLIIAFKAVKCVTFFIGGLTLLTLIGKDVHEVFEHVVRALHFDVHRAFIVKTMAWLEGVKGRQVEWGAAGMLGYSGVLAAETIGLARRRTWAAWLSVIFGSALLPYEVFELVKKISEGRPWVRMALMFLVNIAIVGYLALEARRGARRHAAAAAASAH